MNKKRTKLEIIKDILEVIKSKNGKIKPTHILYKSNLSHIMMELYLKELMDKKLVSEKIDGKNKTYAITEKGNEYLEKYRMISNFTELFGLE
ncbi:MAG: winged helix-turn-helix domain-containing protein [Nanoarchaeota archaeon]|nr:winged helix-turn-helix domain-containing protein [Nanoarchaeota archaeon]